MMAKLCRSRFTSYCGFGAGFLRVADVGPGEGGAEGAEGDGYPGGAGDCGGEGVAVGEQSVEGGAGGGEGDGAGEDAVHRQDAGGDPEEQVADQQEEVGAVGL